MKTIIFKSLNIKILCFSMILGLIPLFIVGITLNILFENSRYDDINARIKNHAQEISLELESLINTKRNELESMALMPAFQSAFREFSETFQQGGSYATSYQDVEDRYMDFIGKITERNGFNDIFLVSNNGLVVFSLLYGPHHGNNLLSDGYAGISISELLKTTIYSVESQVLISDLSEETDKQYIFFSSPMYEQGKYIATLLARVPLSSLYKALERSSLIDSHSSIRVTEKKRQGWQSLPFNSEILMATEDEIQALWEDQNSNFNPGDRVFKVTSIIPSISSIMELEYSEEYILSPILRTRWVMLMFIIAMAMIIVLASSKISHDITRPIKQLRKSFKALANGEKNVFVLSSTQDEIGNLLIQFNSMVKKLRNTENKLVETEKLVSIGNLAAGVAHEINNPMAIVTSNVSSLKEYTKELIEHLSEVDKVLIRNELYESNQAIKLNQSDVSELATEVELIIDETGQSLSRVKDIVASMQVFSEVDKEDFIKLSINELLDDIIKESTNSLDVTIHNNYVKTVFVMGRQKQLKMAFSRLIDNAIKACDKSKKVIQIHVGGNSTEAIICVDDNGCGIEQKNRDKIFDPFFTTRAVGKGIGLGLAISYSIIRSHNGNISVQSVVGKGSRFKVSLPMLK